MVLRLIKQNATLLLSKIKYFFHKREKNVWVFGEWLGEKCCDNCLYFANYVVCNHSKIKCVWIYKEGTNLSLLDDRVERVVMDTPEANSFLKHAGAVFFTHGMGDLTFDYQHLYSGALAVDFWHGVPWKKIHADMYTNKIKRAYWKYQTRMFEGNVYLSTSDVFSRIIQSAFGCKRDSIIESGYPRNSIFYNPEELLKCRNNLIKRLSCTNPSISQKTHIIAYMPTFRDKGETENMDIMIRDNETINNVLESNNAVIVKKSHFVNQHNNTSIDGSSRFVGVENISSQELLASADLLITDYSSCFFDYLVLDRPIIHFLYDYDYYSSKDRGVYYTKEQVVCGDTAFDLQQLSVLLKQNLLNPQKDHNLRVLRRNQFMTYESEQSCEVIFADITRRLEK